MSTIIIQMQYINANQKPVSKNTPPINIQHTAVAAQEILILQT